MMSWSWKRLYASFTHVGDWCNFWLEVRGCVKHPYFQFVLSVFGWDLTFGLQEP